MDETAIPNRDTPTSPSSGWKVTAGSQAQWVSPHQRAVAQRSQRQDCMRCASGIRARAVGSILILLHQHGVSKQVLRAGAQAFGLPHRGQR